ncbi:MAG: hypothetical protein AAF945_03195 [Actinomycetota bacterium]
MTFHERSALTTIVAVLVTFGAYFFVLIAGVDRRVDDIAYKPLLVLTVIVLTAIMAISHIVLAVRAPDEANHLDERDRTISQRADQVAGVVLACVVLLVIFLTMVEAAHVYIANSLLLGLVISQVAGDSTKLVLYRRSS